MTTPKRPAKPKAAKARASGTRRTTTTPKAPPQRASAARTPKTTPKRSSAPRAADTGPENVVPIGSARRAAAERQVARGTARHARRKKAEDDDADIPPMPVYPGVNKGGRPSKLTDDLQSELTGYIAGGQFPEVAASLVRLHRATYYRWMAWGAMTREAAVEAEMEYTELQRFRDFRDAVLEAQDFAEARAVSAIQAAGFGPERQWTALAWYLERTRRARYGRERYGAGALGGIDTATAATAEAAHQHDAGRAADILNVLAEAGALEMAMAKPPNDPDTPAEESAETSS